MNGVHDMGGMHGFGPVVAEADEPVFHFSWEGRLFGMRRAAGAWKRWNIDASRYAVERVPPAEYLKASYYARQYIAFEKLLIERGLATAEEIETRRPADGSPRLSPALLAAHVPEMVRRGSPTRRDTAVAPQLHVGQTVCAKEIHPLHHTRLPRYARGRRGVVIRYHGVFVFPDANAQFRGESPEPLYSVRFAARELWGERANPRDSVCLDLWESYLEAV
jgi:nitrile hydratase subunit beta